MWIHAYYYTHVAVGARNWKSEPWTAEYYTLQNEEFQVLIRPHNEFNINSVSMKVWLSLLSFHWIQFATCPCFNAGDLEL
jgi:hypothetical protein